MRLYQDYGKEHRNYYDGFGAWGGSKSRGNPNRDTKQKSFSLRNSGDKRETGSRKPMGQGLGQGSLKPQTLHPKVFNLKPCILIIHHPPQRCISCPCDPKPPCLGLGSGICVLVKRRALQLRTMQSCILFISPRMFSPAVLREDPEIGEPALNPNPKSESLSKLFLLVLSRK